MPPLKIHLLSFRHNLIVDFVKEQLNCPFIVCKWTTHTRARGCNDIRIRSHKIKPYRLLFGSEEETEKYRRVSVDWLSSPQNRKYCSSVFHATIWQPLIVLRWLNSDQRRRNIEQIVCVKTFKTRTVRQCVLFFLQYVLCCDFLCASSLFRVNHVLCSSEIVWNLMLISCRFPTSLRWVGTHKTRTSFCESEYAICIRQNHNATIDKENRKNVRARRETLKSSIS